jgi:hypothetical protein
MNLLARPPMQIDIDIYEAAAHRSIVRQLEGVLDLEGCRNGRAGDLSVLACCHMCSAVSDKHSCVQTRCMMFGVYLSARTDFIGVYAPLCLSIERSEDAAWT